VVNHVAIEQAPRACLPRAIVEVETIRLSAQPNVVFVHLVDEAGGVGLGESFFAATAVEAYIHDALAAKLFSVENPSPVSVEGAVESYLGYQGSGVETRARGAVDIALWDLLGKRAGLPLVDLIGGSSRDQIDAYNTCAGPTYVSRTSHQESSNWWNPLVDEGVHEDLKSFLTRPGELAVELVEAGFVGMKIWPFDECAEASDGRHISKTDLDAGLEIVAEIRRTVGRDIDVMIELHSLWMPQPAQQIIDALQPFDIRWVEDPVRADAVEALAGLVQGTTTTVAVGETVTGVRGFLELARARAVDLVTLDVQWCGGLTEALRIAALARAFSLPIAPHDCTGPVSLAVASHLSFNQRHSLVQETCRAFIDGWYRSVAIGVPVVENGRISRPTEPGHGVSLCPELDSSPDVSRRVSRR